MKFIVLGFTFIIILLAQLTFANLLSIYEIKPDFVLAFLVYISLKYGSQSGTTSGFGMGLITDCFMPHLFGLNALCKTFIGFLVSVMPRRITGTAHLDGGLLLFFGALIHDFIFNFIYSLGSDAGLFFIFFRYALPGAIYTTLIGVITFAIYPEFLKVKYEQP